MTADRGTMADVDHAHPHDDPCVVDAFCRGPRVVAADGGRRPSDAPDAPEAPEKPDADDGPADPGAGTGSERRPADGPDGTMADVAHTPDVGHDANRVWDGTRVHDGDRDDDE